MNLINRLIMGPGSAWNISKTSVTKWWAMDPFRQSSIIAYYAIFSLPALLVIIVSIAGFAFGPEVVSGKLHQQITNTMGADTAEQIKVMMEKASETKTSVWATIIGAITVITGAIGVFMELQKTLNIIWEVEAAPKRKGIWGFLRTRVFSFGLILSIAFLLMISLVISAGLAAASEALRADSSKVIALLFEGLNFIISLAAISFLFALMFKFLPDAKIKWKHVYMGALVTGVLFTIGKTALAFYFGKANPASGYGAAGSIVLILLWVSYSSMILFLGAEFTHTYADIVSGGVPPDENGAKRGTTDAQEADKFEKKTKAGTLPLSQAAGQRHERVNEEPAAPGEKPADKDDKDKRTQAGNRLLKFAPLVFPLVAIINFLLPFLLPMIVKKMAKKYGATVELKRVTISFFGSTIGMKQLVLRYGNSEDAEYSVVASLETAALKWQPGGFKKGLVDIQSFVLNEPFIEMVQGKWQADKTAKDLSSSETAKPSEPIPVILRSFTIANAKVQYRNPHTHPATAAVAENINLEILSDDESMLQLSTFRIHIEASLLDGILKSRIVLKPGVSLPSFSARLELLSLNLVGLNSFFEAYGKIDLHSGRLDVFSEVVADKGELKGYVKPLLKDLKLLGEEDKDKPLIDKIKEGMVDVVSEVLENQSHDQVATEIPVKGSIENPEVNILHALAALGVNIFIQALSPGFKRYFNFNFDDKKNWTKIGN